MNERAPLTLFPVGPTVAARPVRSQDAPVAPQGRCGGCERFAVAVDALTALLEAYRVLEEGSMADMLVRTVTASDEWRELRRAARDVRGGVHGQ